MPHVSNEDLKKFGEEFWQSTKRIGDGRIALDSNAVRAAVRNRKAAAYRYVEIHCSMAASQPGYLQPALLVAGAYQVEFGDDTLMQMVMRKAEETDAMEHLQRVGLAPSMADLLKEAPERETAKHWWKSSGKQEAVCDLCQSPVQRGDGYLLNGRLVMVAAKKWNFGKELLCSRCFEKHRDDPRDPDGEDGDYDCYLS